MSEEVPWPACFACKYEGRGRPCFQNDRLDTPRLVRTWREYQRLSAGSRDERKRADDLFWVWECYDTLAHHAPEKALELICDTLDAVDSDKEIGLLAAGPMEDLIAGHGESVIDEVERLAWSDLKFRQMLLGVWSQGNDDSEVWQRVLRARAGKRPESLSRKPTKPHGA
ncbi:MAG TPA: hypothetical protein VLA52_02875 [Thermohalobaculum sp.]|nr:hypothetical protein [Thermohalobaculum sp.]